MKKEDLFLGIDIGGTNTVVGLVTGTGEMIGKNTFPTFAGKSIKTFQQNLEKTCLQLVNSRKDHLLGLGIGMPGANSEKGTVFNPVNFVWGDVNLADMIRDQLKLPVFVTNDARASALGEMKFGNAVDLQTFIQITLGTGLGSSFVSRKEIINGNEGIAGEMGHTKIINKNRMCKCGKRGCLETYVSASGVIRTVFELLGSETIDSHMRDLSFNDLSSEAVTSWAEKGDELAQKAYLLTGEILGEKLADFVHIFNPEAIIISGGLAKAGKFLFEPMKHALNENLLPSHKNKTQIRISDPDVNYAVLGAASLVMNNVE
jgi:glucokinase